MVEPHVHIGFAKRDITPPAGLPMAGYSARDGVATGTLDGIKARAMVVLAPHTGARIAFVTADLVAYSPDTIDAFRKRVRAEAGIAPDDVVLAVTHTHSGPSYGAMFPSFDGGLAQESEVSLRWGEGLPDVLVDIVREAIANAQPATLSFGSTRVALATHRRLIDPLGEVRLAPNPDGIIDPEVHVMHARAASDGTTIGSLVNYACHPVVLCEDNLLYSGDFPAYLLAGLEADGGDAIYLNGACGNLNPKRRGDAAAARAHGEALAGAVKALVSGLEPSLPNPVIIATEDVSIPIRLPPREAFETYLTATEQALEAHADPSNFEGLRLAAEVARAQRLLAKVYPRRRRLEHRIQGDTLLVRLQVARIGPALFVALPGETFVEFGLDLRRELGSPHVFVLGYTNESIGYVPTRAAYDEGGYEVTSSHLTPGAGELLTASAVAATRRLLALDQQAG